MNYRRLLIATVLFFCFSVAKSQLAGYYFPADTRFDPAIPTPQRVLGYEVGAWHVTHDQLVRYIETLNRTSRRTRLDTIGYTYEQRPLLNLIISSPANINRLEEIRRQHLALSDPTASARLDIRHMPAVVYLGFSIHGNEPSGSNASMLLAYYLTAGRDAWVDSLLRHTIVILDPSFNPDGLNRFANWANMHRGIVHPDATPLSREHVEGWPSGRTNHYWFDLNRDWLPAQHPESQARLAQYHKWKPNWLTDHHEMGSNGTFFFQPGVSARIHPLIPTRVDSLTRRMVPYYRHALDSIGSLYYAEEGFDDFYFGKGSTYPDINGAVGILFEQASSRGHRQETDNGLLTFPFTIRNHLNAALATLRGVGEMRTDLLEHQRRFYQDAVREAEASPVQAWVVNLGRDVSRQTWLLGLLARHQIGAYALQQEIKSGGEVFVPGQACLIPAIQPQYKLIRALFEVETSFRDSLFYDISTWTLPLAANLSYATLDRKALREAGIGPQLVQAPGTTRVQATADAYAWLVRWDYDLAPRMLDVLLRTGVRVKVATQPVGIAGVAYPEGTLMIARQGQTLPPVQIAPLLDSLANVCQVPVVSLAGGETSLGYLGSSTFRLVEPPRILLLAGEGTEAYEVGEIWHLFDYRYQVPVTMGDISQLSRIKLDDFEVIIMSDGAYNTLPSAFEGQLRPWLDKGGRLIAMQGAVSWLAAHAVGGVSLKTLAADTLKQRPYNTREQVSGARVTGGAICKVTLDLTHPICYGYNRQDAFVFRNNNLFLLPSANPYASPVRYQASPLISGYMDEANANMLRDKASVTVTRVGAGVVIAMSDNPAFRAYWIGTNKLLANAVYFGGIIQQ
ncbi:MAG: M14 family zinc carboxypeptidase [Bacteroidia bacterium]|nr:M14 family zinc carboxypeptidase [Bacteroidia bacterium]